MPFPVTPVLDNFNRANTGPPPSASWTTTPFAYAPPGHEVVSNRMAPDTGGAYGGSYAASYWSASTVGPNCEVYVTAVSVTYRVIVFLRMKDMSSGNIDNYHVDFHFLDDTVKFFREDNEVNTQLGSTVSQALVNGDVVGLRMVWGTMSAFVNGAQVAEHTGEFTYTAAGYLGVYTDDASAVLDDFGGGTLVAPAFAPPSRRFLHMIVR